MRHDRVVETTSHAASTGRSNPIVRVMESASIALIFAAASLCAAVAQAQTPQERNEDCLMCHEFMEDEVSFPDGSTINILIEREPWESSVHGEELVCTDCHRNISDYPHPERLHVDARDYQLSLSESCNRCHYAYYTRVIDSMHFAQLESGVREAPTCIDCHGSHDVVNPNQPRIEISRRCARCHDEIAEEYERSVHGRDLLEDDNEDVPVCTDCHGAHAIEDPRVPEFHVSEHQLCANCHSDAERMERYGLNPNVLTTYLDDFHGASNQLYAEGAGTPEQPLATCTDCHGVHDIQPFDSTGGPDAIRQRVAEMCRSCHEEVPDTFADAWLYHYEPTLQSAPLVWLVTWFYRIVIPLIMAGLVLHILLHLWRVRTHR